MVEWSEKLRNEDYGVFCRAAIQMSKAENYPVWIVSDARRKTDIKWFKENYNNEIIKLYRIVCDDGIRKQRGWEFTEGIDDKETECGLDDFDNWDQIIENNSSDEISHENAIKTFNTCFEWTNGYINYQSLVFLRNL
ncbi:unnamed protein product [Nezara viridula]|uniref:Phosphomevalonate kinase n=1 Tax=Nezara viridula TaxID=85310 RepID=A0A9P0HLE2_NEZVI|nr:unnamed protein product [Nezara viridula]